MNIIDTKIILRLDVINEQLYNSVGNSSFESLNMFESIQVHAGCGGCYGTQMSCIGTTPEA
jgi:hypothetical protein